MITYLFIYLADYEKGKLANNRYCIRSRQKGKFMFRKCTLTEDFHWEELHGNMMRIIKEDSWLSANATDYVVVLFGSSIFVNWSLPKKHAYKLH